MAAAAAVLGGMVGFLVALTAWALGDYSIPQVLALWSGTGLLAAAVLMALGHSLHHAPAGQDAGLDHPGRAVG